MPYSNFSVGTSYRNGILHGWRGILTLWVLLGHIDHIVGLHMPVLRAPGYAVDVFIVLSGYFIHASISSLAKKHGTIDTALMFYQQRGLRIWPAYAVTLIASIVIFEVYLRLTSQTRMAELSSNVTPFNTLMHLSLLNGLFPTYVSSAVIPSWSLSLELQFYLLYPLLFFTQTYRSIPLIVVALLLAYASPYLLGNYEQLGLWAHYGLPSILPYRLFYFLLGVAWQIEIKGEARVGVKLLIFIAFFINPFSAAAIAVVYVSNLPQTRRFAAPLLEHNLMQFFGQISYSLYLVHAPVVLLAWWALQSLPFNLSTASLNFVLLSVLSVPISTGLAFLLYQYVEQRFHHAKKVLT
jgi:peptidoglycan/LPS O-acetylase OafA/YrhL